eukprot:COSAG06_NODE_22115_length_733_cov_1.550473_1_plen_202_part_00
MVGALPGTVTAILGGQTVGTLTRASMDGPVTGTGGLDWQLWDSGDIINSAGKTFTLYLLPVEPPGTFAWDASGARAYADTCRRAGLRTVTTAASSGVTRCTQLYNCMPVMPTQGLPCMLPAGVLNNNGNRQGDCDSRLPHGWLRTLGWTDFVADGGCYTSCFEGRFPMYLDTETDPRGVAHGQDRPGSWNIPLHAVCGMEH